MAMVPELDVSENLFLGKELYKKPPFGFILDKKVMKDKSRVFLKEPSLVILDEASSRLDPATEIHLERAIEKLLQKRGAIIIAHRLATVKRADDILILEDGEIIEYGERIKLAQDPNSKFAHLLKEGISEVLA